MNPDVSVAPEIAQLMEPPRPVSGRPVPSPARPTVGDLARELRQLTGAPDRWWSLVRFDAEHPVQVDIPTDGSYRAWLSILPPATQDDQPCRCGLVTVVAGELTEHATHHPPQRLLPGQVRVHGAPGPHQAVNTSDGYTVSVHLRARPGQ